MDFDSPADGVDENMFNFEANDDINISENFEHAPQVVSEFVHCT